MAIYDFFLSRNNAVSNAAAYVGHVGRLFYDSNNGVIKISDGVTPGGTFIPYNIATASTVGGIKVGPGANVAVDGTLTIDTAGLPLSFGNLSVVDTTMSTVNPNADLILASNGTGNVELVGNIQFHTTASPSSEAFFTASSDGQITILVPATDPFAGAVKIVGSTTGNVSPPLNSGVMLQLTGNNNDASRFYNDAIGGFAAFVGRRINGNLSFPTAVQAGEEIIRISSTGHDGNSVPGTGTGRIVYQAKETYTTTARGTNVSIWSTAIGSTVLTKTATFDVESGVTLTKATVQGNLTVGGSIVGNAVATTATLGSATVSGNVSAGNVTVNANGTLTTPRIVYSGTGVRAIQDGIYANLQFGIDSIVHCYNPSGDLTVNINSYAAGAQITLIISMDTRRTINFGVPTARNSTTGATSLPSTSLVSPQSVQLTYTCVDGTAANTYVAVSRV